MSPDPSVLNCRIEDNGFGALVLLDGPVFSAEYNELRHNQVAEIQLVYRSGICNPTSSSPAEARCAVRPNRTNRNNIVVGNDLFLVRPYGTYAVPGPATYTGWFNPLDLTSNYFGGLNADQVRQQIEWTSPQGQGQPQALLLDPVLACPEPQAGLMEPIPFE